MNLRSKFFILITIGVFLTGQWGCATGRYGYPKPEPLLEKYREQLGTIGVATGPDVPVIEIDTPPPTYTGPGVLERTGQGAVEGAENSYKWWTDNLPEAAEGLPELLPAPLLAAAYVALLLSWLILTIPVTMFGGLGGAIGGALPPDDPFAYPAADEVTLRHTVANYPIQETFQSSFLKEARARTSHTFVRVPEEGPQTSEGMVGQSVDTVLELSVQRIWLKLVDDREPELNPPMALVLFVRARLVRGTEKTLWYDQTFVHETKKRPYKEWPYHYHFQTDIEKAYHNLAEQLVSELFLKTQTSKQ